MAGVDPASLGDPEEIINYILGFALGAKGSGGAIDPAVTLKAIESPGGAPWIQHTSQGDKLTGGWYPGKEDGKIVFWRKMKGTFVEWVHVSLAGAATPGLNKADSGSSAGTLGAIKEAWGALVTEAPGLVGPGKVLDGNSIGETAIMFEGAARYFDLNLNSLKTQIEQLDQNEATFRGSASESYVQRVRTAMVKVEGARAAADKWQKALGDSAASANAFGNDLRNRVTNLHSAEGGRLLVPQNYVISLFNSATLTTTADLTLEMNRNKNKDLASNGVAGAIEGSAVLDQMNFTPTMMISFPGSIEGGPWDVFVPAVWPQIDALMRASWVKKVREVFNAPISITDPNDKNKTTNSGSFGGSAANLINSFNTAAPLLVPPSIRPNPKGRRPPPGPGPINFNPNFDIGGVNYPNYNPNFPEYNPNFPEFNSNLPNFDNTGPNVGSGSDLPGVDLGGGGALPGGVGLGGSGLPDGSTLLGGGGLLGSDGGPASNLGDLSPDQLAGLQASGALDNVPLTDAQLADLAAAGMPMPAGSMLGDLSPAQLARLQKDGLLDDQALTPDQASVLNGLGLGDGTAQNLGDLSAQQLDQLKADGLLDDIPLTPEQISQLQQDGLLGANADGLSDLGDLSPAQLQDLQQAGMLDDIPLTDGQLNALGLDPAGETLSTFGASDAPPLLGNSDLSSLATNLPDTDFGGDLPTSQFPTTVDGLDVTPTQLGANDKGFSLGDVSKPLSHSVLGGAAGVGGGGLPVSGGAGGGLGGGIGGVGGGIDGLGTTPGSDLGGSRAPDKAFGQSSAVGGPGALAGSAGSAGTGGMPFMPPMGGMGGGGGGGQEKSRERKTWLTEDEDVWGTDPDCAPAVIGRDGGIEGVEPVESPTVPVGPRPVRPGRAQPRRGQS
jgi:hypothetical protein